MLFISDMSFAELKDKILKLLREDVEFRYAVAGLLGLEEILKRLDSVERAIEEHTKSIRSLQEQVLENTKAIRSLQEQVRSMQEQVREHSLILMEHTKEIRRLSDRISALGARWGIMAESVFRESLERFLQEYFKVAKVGKWKYFDEKGEIFGAPALIEIDVVVKDQKHLLIEVKSSASVNDVAIFNKKCELYKKIKGVTEVEKYLVTCFIDEKAKELARELNITVVTY
ncbi:MAG: hypothetical protein DRN15_09805 [Thermoprotei archaeon]|nr:MAG: hypothetical protein DRN15_09805 [Thermoprotei archaeon]